nr:MAG TPA: hypothetical protein [Caudoviricetes sp.]
MIHILVNCANRFVMPCHQLFFSSFFLPYLIKY